METNPYKIEEQLWTPPLVYDADLAATFNRSSYALTKGEDGVSPEEAEKSLFDGVKDFFANAIATLGKIAGGAVSAGVGVFSAFAEGITELIGHLGEALGSLFKGAAETDLPPIFSPIKTNLEDALEPHLKKIEDATDRINSSVQVQQDLSSQIAALDVRMDGALEKIAETNSEFEQSKMEYDELALAAAEQMEAIQRIGEETERAVKEAQSVTSEFTSFKEQNERGINEAQESARNAVLKAQDTATALGSYKSQQEDLMNQLEDKAQKGVKDAERSLSRTTHMLNRPERGTSVLAYKPPKDADLENPGGNPDWDIPEWTDLAILRRDKATSESSSLSFMSGMPHETMWGVDSSARNRETSGGWMNVEPGQLYKLSYWHRATDFSSRYAIQMYGDGSGNTSLPLRVMTGKTENGDPIFGGATSFAVNTRRMPYERWEYHEAIVKIEPNIRRLRFARIWWNYSESTGSEQWIAGLDFATNVPSQQQVDEAQTKAIKSLDEFRVQSTTLASIQQNMISKNEMVANSNRTAIQGIQDGITALENFRTAQDRWNIEQEHINSDVENALNAIEQLQRKQAEYIVRILYRPSGVAVEDDYVSVSTRGEVTAKNAWGGVAIVDMTRTESESVTGSGSGDVKVNKREIVQSQVDTSRTIVSGNLNAQRSDMIIHYWIYQGTPQSSSLSCPSGYITGYRYHADEWSWLSSVAVPATVGNTLIQWKTQLTSADRGCTYGVRVKVDGVVPPGCEVTWKGIGPLTPLGSGDYTMSKLFNLQLSESRGQKVSFETYFSPGKGGGPEQAKASSNEAKLVYIEAKRG